MIQILDPHNTTRDTTIGLSIIFIGFQDDVGLVFVGELYWQR